MNDLWPKYQAIAYQEMQSELKLPTMMAIRLRESELSQLPASSLQNRGDARIFTSFIDADIEIEVCRYLKFSELKLMAEDSIVEAQEKAQKKYPDKKRQIADFFKKIDMQSFILDQVMFVESADDENKKFNEEDIYNKILHQLEPSQKWDHDQSDKYLKKTQSVYKEQVRMVTDELKDVMSKLKSELRELSGKPERKAEE